MPSSHIARRRLAAWGLPAALALTACGGGGGDSPGPGGGGGTALALSGTAATGAAIGGRTVDAKCSGGGSGSAVTAADGSYTLTVSAGGALPCVLRVTLADGSVLHSLAAGSGSTAKANLTPVTELVVARLTGGAPAGFYGSFDASAVTSSGVQAAVTAVVDTLKSAGIDFSATGDLLSGALVAANGSTAGNAMDQALDALKARLASTGTTLTALAGTVAQTSPAATASALGNAPTLPADRLLQPAAPNCAALRSGRYRIVIHDDTGGGDFATELLSLDAPNLRVTDSDNGVAQLTAVGPCRYTTPEGGAITVTPAGIAFLQVDGAPRRGAILIPEQTLPVSAVAGEWNLLGLDRTTDNGPVHLSAATGSFDLTGKLIAVQDCPTLNGACQTATTLPNITITANAAGGFNFVNATAGFTDRLFLYKAGGGETLLITLAPGGHVSYGTRKVARTMPLVADVSQGWQIAINTNATAPFYTSPAAISQFKSTVATLDATAQSYVRTAVTDFGANVTRPETVALNKPRDGYLNRLPATVATSTGATSTVSEWVGLPLRGMGATAVGIVSTNQLFMSAQQAQ